MLKYLVDTNIISEQIRPIPNQKVNQKVKEKKE
jgi:predicted nucleic acid-binding protein